MFNSPNKSLSDLLGEKYTEAVASANEALGIMSKREAMAIANEKINFHPEHFRNKCDALLPKVGTEVVPHFEDSNDGAATNAFSHAENKNSAPLTGIGPYRVGEDGKLYLIGKSEHYHASLGHRFPGYKLINNARKLGILNATHNNTRGYVTRLVEKRLIQTANGIAWDDKAATDKVISSKEPKVLNRVINLETGSLAVEAGVKMMLSRFYKLDNTFDTPKYSGKTPVFLVMEDFHGGPEANYHGTTVITQTFRGLWPEFRQKAEDGELYKVVPVAINDIDDFTKKITEYNTGKYKTAGFLHELILMNYGGVKLDRDYINEVYSLSSQYDTPCMCDEIQTCMWYKGMFLFNLYGLKPDFAIIGKGFPGGEYPASKILTTAEMDTLNQFGALVTNGQEELASLAYLITMTFSKANSDQLESSGERFENGLKKIADRHPEKIVRAEGMGLLGALTFKTVPEAAEFADLMKQKCIDASAQVYKPHCPPALLMKPPMICTEKQIDYILNVIDSLF